MQGKELSEHKPKTEVYIGIDVSIAWLDVHVHPVGQEAASENCWVRNVG